MFKKVFVPLFLPVLVILLLDEFDFATGKGGSLIYSSIYLLMFFTLRIIFKGSRSGEDVINSDRNVWNIEKLKDTTLFFRNISLILPRGSVLVFESGVPSEELNEIYKDYCIPNEDKFDYDGMGIDPESIYLRADEKLLSLLAGASERHAAPEIAMHIIGYRDQKIIFEFYDAFGSNLEIEPSVSEELVVQFAEKTQSQITDRPIQ